MLPLLPSTCREGGISYSAPFHATLCLRYLSASAPALASDTSSLSEAGVVKHNLSMGKVPIMVMSERCRLAGLSQQELVERGEETNEMGGYFIVNGLEKVIRMLTVPRKNYPCAIQRSSWLKRGSAYSDLGVQIRCVKPDQSTASVTLHYLRDGNCLARFTIRKAEYYVPAILLLRAFKDTNDRQLYERLTRCDTKDTFISDRVEFMLRELKRFSVFTREQSLAYLGSRFRAALRGVARPSHSSVEVGKLLLKHYLFVHLKTDDDAKFELLVEIIRKLYSFAKGDIVSDHPDSILNQDVILGGQVFLMLFKENLQKYLAQLAGVYAIEASKTPALLAADMTSEVVVKRMTSRVSMTVGQRMEHFLATGNLVTDTGLDLMQATGFSVIAEKLNFNRFISHFRCVHRGQFFTTMKTTAVRKLQPDSWGFMCPVHTPDGAPCGLLNHLSHTCQITGIAHKYAESQTALQVLLENLGMVPVSNLLVCPASYLTVHLDGRVLGYIPPSLLDSLSTRLRVFKVHGTHGVPKLLEIAAVPAQPLQADGQTGKGGQYPGLYLFLTAARYTRPTLNLRCNAIEWISPFEQAYLNIAVLQDDIRSNTTHAETKPSQILSIVASCTPLSDFNQSPRNMYQCQMAKQTMAFPCHALDRRVDSKTFRIQTPQLPITRNENQTEFPVNDYPSGTNAIVAVISYTGYDMEDAMIINKSAYERGFKHASVYTTKDFDLWDGLTARGDAVKTRYLDNLKRKTDGKSTSTPVETTLDVDGLPQIGQLIQYGEPLYCYYDEVQREHVIVKSKQKEPFYVDQIRMLGTQGAPDVPTHFSIKMRFNRNPVVGDKFASRHGQKGVMSKLWPQIDMPFTDSGMTPDLIINPHAFPSRMTIGMLIESMAGKSGALHGVFQNSTPFTFDETTTPVDFFGEQLVKAGFNYHGNETMYSGVTGEPFPADIFIGVVYYQRLRHMVSDKFQVRSTGPINSLTRQPVKGRKAGGGIRLGEMERDSLLAHGASFILNDRLQNCSDRHIASVCQLCGSILSTATTPNDSTITCRTCASAEGISTVALPYVFRYLTNELAAMNIRVTVDLTQS